MSGQMTREDVLDKLKEPLYASNEQFEENKKFLAVYMEISVKELESLINQAPRAEREYPHSRLNEVAPLARKFRKILG